MITHQKQTGYADAFLNCGGIGYPPYCVRWRGRWWVTEWVRSPVGFQATDNVLSFVRALGQLPFGTVKLQDYLRRSHKGYRDVPQLTDDVLAAVGEGYIGLAEGML